MERTFISAFENKAISDFSHMQHGQLSEMCSETAFFYNTVLILLENLGFLSVLSFVQVLL